MLVTIVLTVFAVVVLSKSVIVVPNGEAWVLERLGRYDRTLPPGLHVIVPFTDRVAFRYSVQPKDEELSDQCVTRDNVPVRVQSVLRAQIANPERAAYATANAGDSLVTLVRTHQRQAIGERSWDNVRLYPRELESAVLSAATEPAAQMGVKLLAIDVKQLDRVE